LGCGNANLLFNFAIYGGDMNKIDLIIENIEYSRLVTEQAHKDELLDEALAAARELKIELAKLAEPPDYVEPPTSEYHNGWEEGFEAAKNLFKKESAPQELAHSKQEFYPDWDMLKPFYERIKELEEQLAKPEQEPVAWAVLRPDGRVKLLSHQQGVEVDLKWTPLYTAPPRKPWVGLTDDEIHKIVDDHTPNDARQEKLTDFVLAVRAAELRLKDKNDTKIYATA
jgi:hypothetical protein